MSYSKILVIRFSSIGDIVLTTPVIRCLKQQLNAEIHYLVKPGFASVIHENPNIDKIHLLKESVSETITILQSESFDLVIDLQKNLRSIRITSGLDCKVIRFDKLNIKKWMAVNLKVNQLPQGKHIVDRYFKALDELGIKDDGEGLDYYIMPEDEYDAQGLINGMKYQVLVLGATYFTKRIPKEKCIDIIVSSEHHTILLGGKDVSELAHELAIIFPEKVINYCGKIGLGVSAGIIKHAQRVVTGDTGLMHIAAAFHKEITVLWGNTIPEFGMYPHYGHKNPDRHIDLQVQNLPCRPCSKLGYDHCPKGHFKCMNEIVVF
ncbi:MAG: glycosyltransferase family 9 protein [Saprospiraceae bacterium]